MANTGGLVSPGSTTALTSGCTAPPMPPSISSGPLMSDEQVRLHRELLVSRVQQRRAGSVMSTAVTVTVCGIHQLVASKINGRADSVVSPSLIGVNVTVPVGALVSRTW